MVINRIWAMPNKNTFSIKPIGELIERYIKDKEVVVDPYANESKLGTITNDLDPQYDTDYHLEAIEFLKLIDSESADVVLFDPPYTQKQVAECYRKLDKTVTIQETQTSYWSRVKEQISRILKPGGYCITCCWNSNGIGKKYGFQIEEILLVPSGSWHNDTIVTVDRKI